MTGQDVAERLLRRDRRLVAALLGTLVLLAGLYTVYGVGMRMSALEMTAMRDMRDMPGPQAAGAWSTGYAVLVFLMWWVMMAAMMVPSVAPTVLLHVALLRHAGPGRVAGRSTAFLAGYLAIWAMFSVLATAAQWGLEATGRVSATMMVLIDTWPGGLLLIAAGIYQFLPLKASCLRQCQSPARFLSEHRRDGIGGAFHMGLHHGAYCLGCCSALMALLFAGGIMNLYWIVGLALFVAVEKLTPLGDRVAKAAGVGLVVWGGMVVWGAV
ncbi:DUF2182 domain-containing protein [Oceanomicrobium pacificus]|uniref:DUF2182 domain-containing protein n=1 Tax=Oceanomicrobium pacificus TaxID=2692916 RepID=UPI002E2E0315|nr:DUF2182 domain-containing protein [Oceanomicrobium pacificus]